MFIFLLFSSSSSSSSSFLSSTTSVKILICLSPFPLSIILLTFNVSCFGTLLDFVTLSVSLLLASDTAPTIDGTLPGVFANAQHRLTYLYHCLHLHQY